MTPRGPNLSVNLPIAIPSKPFITQEREKAPEVIAFVQPKSFSIGLKKTPKAVLTPMLTRKDNEGGDNDAVAGEGCQW